MKNEVTVERSPAPLTGTPADSVQPGPAFRRFFLFTGLLVLCFAKPFYDLARFSFKEEEASHVLLVPVICACLVWFRRERLQQAVGGVRWPGMVLGLIGLAVFVAFRMAHSDGVPVKAADRLPVQMLAFCLLVWSGGFLTLGARFMREYLFPAFFLIFMIPMTPGMIHAVDVVLQRTSAEVAYWFLLWSGTPVLRSGMVFEMPRMTISVGPECSGIRASLVLLLGALLAGHMFLRTGWKRAALVLFVLPLGIVRNALRIFTIAMLCVHLSPSYIESPLHREWWAGGMIFFALSLVPFALILLWFWKTDEPAPGGKPSPLGAATSGEQKTSQKRP